MPRTRGMPWYVKTKPAALKSTPLRPTSKLAGALCARGPAVTRSSSTQNGSPGTARESPTSASRQ